uniref:Large ribosomal subunit protein uL2 n=1 Tax=candidate division CPR3 bacterium TaxID=2268181 RepID=A0A7V3N5I1_UNCC3
MSPIKIHKPTTPSRRFMTAVDVGQIVTKKEPEKSLVLGKKKSGGRSKGRVSVRHKGGGVKRLYRLVDFKQDKFDVPAKVKAIEYDPNRTAFLALLHYADGEKRYILAPAKLNTGDVILSSKNKLELKEGNRMPLKYIPVGTPIFNIELQPGEGGKIVKSAGSSAIITAFENGYVHVKMPSGEIRRILKDCLASIGVVSNPEHNKIKIGKAGRMRHLGVRPTVRGKAMHPSAHPHGGGEGRSPVGLKYPKTPWGKPAKGVKTRKRKYSDKLILKRRR